MMPSVLSCIMWSEKQWEWGEDHGNLQRSGVTHPLHPQQRQASAGGQCSCGASGGPPQGVRDWEGSGGTHAMFSWCGTEKRCWICTYLNHAMLNCTQRA